MLEILALLRFNEQQGNKVTRLQTLLENNSNLNTLYLLKEQLQLP